MNNSFPPSSVAAIYDRRHVYLILLIVLTPLSLFGQGSDNPTGVAGVVNGNSTTGCSYSTYTANAQRIIPDLTVAGAVGKYPLQWSRIMNSRLQKNTFLGAGGGWQHSYQWICTAPGGTSNPPASVTVNYPDGRQTLFTHTSGTTYTSPLGVGDRFVGFVGFGDCTLFLSDGSQVIFYQSVYGDGQGNYNVYYDPPTQIIDPYNLTTTLTYVSGRLAQVTEPAGRRLAIYYGTSGASTGYISEVDALASDGHVSQWVKYTYTTQTFSGTPYNLLTRADYIYASGLEPPPFATYTYQASNVVANGVPLIKTCKDVRYPGPMKNIGYDFTSTTYGRLWHENHLNSDGSFTTVVTLAVPNSTTRTETRGDGPTRTFTYGATPSGGTNVPFLLKSYTDFIAKSPKNTTTLGYGPNGFITSVQDPNLHTTLFTHNGLTGAITQITHSGDGSYIKYDYEDPLTCYYLKSTTDELGHVTTYKHSNTTTMTTSEIDYPDGGIEKYVYNGYNQVTSHTMVGNSATAPSGGTEIYTYDTGNKGLLVSYTPPATPLDGDPNPSLHPTRYTYDANDHLSTITDPRGNVTTLWHNEIGQLTIEEHDDVDTSQIVYSYNADGTLASKNEQLTATEWALTSYTYDDYKRLRTVTTPDRFSGDTMPHTTNFWYDINGTGVDGYGHTEGTVTLQVSPSGKLIKTLYDENWRKTSVTVGDNTYADSLPATITYTYDAAGNLKTMKDPNGQSSGATWTYNYDVRDRLINVIDPVATDRNSLGHTVDYTYDLAGNRKTTRRANDQITTYDTYDLMNRLTQMTVGQYPTASAVTHYTWTKAGKVDTMTDPGGNVYNHDYDLLNRPSTITFPGGSTEKYTYDIASNVATFTNRAGNVQTFTYDSRNRETRYDWNDGVTPYRTLSYDDASRILTCYQNALLTRSYFNDGLLQSEHILNYNYGDYDGTISYTYNADGARATVTYPSGRKLSMGYTGRNELRTIYDITNGSTSIYQAWYIYDPSGNLTNRNINLAQTHTTISSYDAVNRPGQIQHFLVGSSPKFNYAYDELGRRKYEQHDGGPADGYGYDNNDELNSFWYDGTTSGPPTGTSANTVGYGAPGNRTSLVANGTTTTYATANNLSQYPAVGGLSATYDVNGNLKTYNGWTYTYDAMNRLTTVAKGSTSASFWYDGFNRVCTWQENGSANHKFNVWDGWNLVAEYGESNALQSEYLHGGLSDEMVSMIKNGQTYYYFQDGRGNTSHLVDSSGALVETCRYDVFGAPTVTLATGQSATGNRFLFTGREYFASVGHYNYRNRFYMPEWGRFLQPDPIGFSGDPANLYRYCANNPVNWSDPYGLNIEVVEYPASIWGVDYNHVGVHVTGMPATQAWTVGYYPNAEHSPDAPGVVKPDLETPIPGRNVDIPTTIEQDEAANAYIDQVTNDSDDEYTFWDQNCARFVEGVLKAAGLPNVPTSVAPGTLINKLKKKYDKGPFADVHVNLRTGVGGGGPGGLGGGNGLLGVGTVMWGGEPWGIVPAGRVLMGKDSEDFVKKYGKNHG